LSGLQGTWTTTPNESQRNPLVVTFISNSK
jgi:hypothetical protein